MLAISLNVDDVAVLQTAALPMFASPSANVATTKVFRLGGTTGGSNITYHTLTYSEGRFAGGVLTILNGLAAGINIDGVAIAATAAPNDNINPVNSAGSAQAWTYLSGGPWTAPAAPVAGTTAAIPSVLKIPFTLASIDRTDIIDAPCLLMVRIHATTPISAGSPSSAEMNGIGTITSSNRFQQGYFKSQTLANFNIPANFTTPTQQFLGCLGVQFTAPVSSYSVLVLGDSTHQGANSTSGYWGCIARAAAALTTLARPVSVINCGFQGQTPDQTFATADTWINTYAPQAVTIPFYSVNAAPSTQGAADATLQKAFALAAKCVASGIKPFLVTPNPATSLAFAADNIRKQTILNAKAGPYTVIDMAAAVGDGASPERITAAYTADGTHCNDAGYDRQDTIAARPALGLWLSEGLSMPTGALGMWDASNYVATPRKMVRNSAVALGPVDGNILAAPRRMFYRYDITDAFWSNYGAITVTDNVAAAPDGSIEASTIVGSGVSNWGEPFRTMSLPAGDYTAAISIKSVAGETVRLEIAGVQNEAVDKTVTTSWSRISTTFTITSAGNIDFRLSAPAAGSNPNLTIVDFQVYTGTVDQNTTWATLKPLAIRNADALVGYSQYSTGGLASGMVSDAALSFVQLDQQQTPSDYTVISCSLPTSSGAGGNKAMLSRLGADWYRFVMGFEVDVSGGGQWFNGTLIGGNANGKVTSGSSWGRQSAGLTTAVQRKNGSATTTFINGLKLQDGTPEFIPSTPTLHNLTLGGVRTNNQELLSGHGWGLIAYYPRALSDAEVTQALAYMKSRFGDVGLKRVLGIDGTSITQILQTYQSYVGPNLNPQRLVTCQAVASATIASANATHVAALDAIISAGPPMNEYVLSIELGTNDLFTGRTDTQVIADLKSYILARRAAGWQKFLLFTILPRNPSGSSYTEAQFDAHRLSVNTTLRADVGTWFDKLVDQAANSTIGADGAWTNTTNYPDGTHPSAGAHQTIIEPLARAQVNAI